MCSVYFFSVSVQFVSDFEVFSVAVRVLKTRVFSERLVPQNRVINGLGAMLRRWS